MLIAYGEENSLAIAKSGIKGSHVPINTIRVVVVEIEKTWRIVIKTVLVKLSEPSTLDRIYKEVVSAADGKVKSNPHYKAKIRQILQRHYRIAPFTPTRTSAKSKC